LCPDGLERRNPNGIGFGSFCTGFLKQECVTW
jgi:hypothetical protein